MRAWHRDHPDASHVAIELPTGAGKTLVGGPIGGSFDEDDELGAAAGADEQGGGCGEAEGDGEDADGGGDGRSGPGAREESRS